MLLKVRKAGGGGMTDGRGEMAEGNGHMTNDEQQMVDGDGQVADGKPEGQGAEDEGPGTNGECKNVEESIELVAEAVTTGQKVTNEATKELTQVSEAHAAAPEQCNPPAPNEPKMRRSRGLWERRLASRS